MSSDNNKILGLKRMSFSQARSVLDVLGNEAQPKWKFYKEMKDAASEVLDNEVKITMELPLEDGSSYTWVLASPQALLRKFVAASFRVAERFGFSRRRQLEKRPFIARPLSRRGHSG